MNENKNWLSDKDCLAFYSFCDSAVNKSKLKGSYRGGDVAMRVMEANHGKPLEELKKFVPAAVLAEFKDYKIGLDSPEKKDRHESDAKTNWKFKMETDDVARRKNQDNKNRSAREDITNKTEHSKYRRHQDKLRKREKARVKKRKKKSDKKLDKKITRRVKLDARI